MACAYCGSVISIKNYFTYNGCTAIFFSMNYIAVSYLTYKKSSNSQVSLSILTKHLASVPDLNALGDDDMERLNKDIIECAKK